MRKLMAVTAVTACGVAATAAGAVAGPAASGAAGGAVRKAHVIPAAGGARAGHVISPSGAAVATSSAAATQRLELVLPLTARDAALQRFAAAVTDPGSPRYRHYRSIAWLSARFGASAAQRSRVIDYLRAHGATDVHVDATGMFVDAAMPAERAAAVFQTDIITHSAPVAQPYTTPTRTPTVPAALRGDVSGVVGLDSEPMQVSPGVARLESAGREDTGLTRLSSTTTTSTATGTGTGYRSVTGIPSGCSAALHMNRAATGEKTGFAPNQYLSAYDYAGLHSANIKGQGERVALIEIDGFTASNITTFARCFKLHVPAITAYGVGISKPLAAGPETTLDLEVLDAAAPRLKAINVYESGSQPASVLRSLTAPLENRGRVPQVISASLGLCEPQMRAAVGTAGIQASQAALAVAAAHGITVLAATGDDGSSGCVSSEGEPLDKVAVNYPSSSRWVTAVGGTQLWLSKHNTITSSAVWNDGSEDPGYASGGGVSTLGGGLPAYQRGTVSGTHREVPDVALLADVAPGYDIYCTVKGESNCAGIGWEPVGGTSAATPLLAGGIALIDQDLRTHGRKQLGLANPFLYTLGRSARDAAVFSDVTAGNNDVAPFVYGRTLSCCTATAGYDDASGWGGINLKQLAVAALK